MRDVLEGLAFFNADVHHDMTRLWAEQEGFTPEAAAEIAEADVLVDRHFPPHEPRCYAHHFPVAGSFFRARRYLRSAVRDRSLSELGIALHIVQDSFAHGITGHWLRRRCDLWAERGTFVQSLVERTSRRFLRRFLDADKQG